MSRPRSLTTRLVATAVGLVALVSVLVAAASAVALHAYLQGKVDGQVRGAEHRFAQGAAFGHGEGGRGGFDGGDGEGDDPFQRGEFVAYVDPDGPTATYQLGPHTGLEAPADDAEAMRDLPTDDQVHNLDLGGGRHYRAAAVPSGSGALVFAVPDSAVGSAVRTLLVGEAGFILLGVAGAGAGGYLLVRRQLAPLREVAATAHAVAAMPLSRGEVGVTARVPDSLTDDRTEVGQMGAALNTLLGQVETALDARHRSEQHVRQFVADASHELRTPLATIQGYAELARRTHAQEPGALLEALEKVEAEGVRMTSLVEDLLLLARLDAGRPLAQDEVDLTRSVLEAVSDARVVSPDHRWRLELPDDPVTVPGDELRLRQVLVNLLSNAARHTPAGTTVTVTVEEDLAGGASVQVHDDGPGIPEALQQSVFERFTRADTARTRQVGGAGLGLSLARAIARAHGGDLDLVSRPGSTTFALRLPSAEVAPHLVVPAVTRL